MAKNLIDGENIVIEENGNNINMNFSNNANKNLNVYSTTETVIGTWIDGKPIYRKVIDCGSMPNNTTKYITHNISVETPIKCSGIIINPQTDMRFTMPLGGVSVWGDVTQICIITTTDRSATNGLAIFEYTKTTD